MIKLLDILKELKIQPEIPQIKGRIINEPHNSEIYFPELERKFYLNDDYAFISLYHRGKESAKIIQILHDKRIPYELFQSEGSSMHDIIIPIEYIEFSNH